MCLLLVLGNVGGKLLSQLHQQMQYLKEHMRLQIQVVGIANSKKSILDDAGIDLTNWKSLLDQAPEADIHSFVALDY
jgi:aspartokinase/homoserine dehydrogenase 1